ncbi:MAG: hypothetical protein MSC31_18305 [Solirubrobacteraceae bacterium MAG38_C4-C5]|nr:hypothetical protein [Candidatus Siliceabacter maunaloa]
MSGLAAPTLPGPGLEPVARRRAAHLRDAGLDVVVVDCHADGLDAPLVVLAALAEQLERLDPNCSLAARFADQLQMWRRLELLDESLQAASPDVVLFDAPELWGGQCRGARHRCETIVRRIEQAGWRTERAPDREPEQLHDALLALAEAAGQNVSQLAHPPRAVGALASAVLARLSSGAGRRYLARLTIDGVYRDWHLPPTGEAGTLVEALMEFDGNLRRLAREVAEQLPASATGAARRRRALGEVREALTAAGAERAPERHRLRVEATALAALLSEAETVDEIGVIGSEQLTLLAASLSARAVDRGRAQETAERAVALDGEDIDALRTLAGLVDDAGIDLSEARRLWQDLVMLDQGDQDAHQALVSAMLADADEPAAQLAWQWAGLDLEKHHQAPDPDRLHLPIAATALARSRTRIAREVLFDVPPNRRMPAWRSLVDVLEALEAARQHEDVLPVGEMTDRWWEQGPRRLAGRDPVDGARLISWLAGRVSALDLQDQVAVIQGMQVIDGDPGPPQTQELMMTADLYERLAADSVAFEDLADRYVELGVYQPEAGPERSILRVRRRPEPLALPARRSPSRAWRDLR